MAPQSTTEAPEERILGIFNDAQAITFGILSVGLIVLIISVILFFVCYVNKLEIEGEKESAQIPEPSSQLVSTVNQNSQELIQEGNQVQTDQKDGLPSSERLHYQPPQTNYEPLGQHDQLNLGPLNKPKKSPAPRNYETLGRTHLPGAPGVYEDVDLNSRIPFAPGSAHEDETSASEKSEKTQKTSEKHQKDSEKSQRAKQQKVDISEHEVQPLLHNPDPEPTKAIGAPAAKDSYFAKTKKTTATTQAATKESGGSGSKEKTIKKASTTQNESDPRPHKTRTTQQDTKDTQATQQNTKETQATQQHTKESAETKTTKNTVGTMEESDDPAPAKPASEDLQSKEAF
uniref:Uncharacterized protein n=1 Tax=Panagrolaimus davidi TaxID=227884 RepID=A0A914Q5T3_9BILA